MRYILFIFSLLIAFAIKAQEPVSIHLTDKDGLPDIEFYSMVEDSEGYIWFASDKGLNRYDGKEFKKYTNPKQKSRSFFNLKIGPQGKVWCNNITGQFFYIDNDELKLFDDYQQYLKGKLVSFDFFNNHLLLHKHKEILVIDLFSKENIKTLPITSSTGLGIALEKRYLLLGKSKNIIWLDEQFRIQRFPILFKEKISLYTYFQKYQNNVFIFCRDKYMQQTKLVKFDYNNQISSYIQLPKILSKTYVYGGIVIDENLYLETNAGVFKTLFKNNQLTIQKHFFKDEFITDLLEDQNQNIWVSTLRDGVYVIPNEHLTKHIQLEVLSVLERKNDSIYYMVHQAEHLLVFNSHTNQLKKMGVVTKGTIRALYSHPKTYDLLVATDTETFIYNEQTKKKEILLGKATIKSVSYICDTTYLFSKHNGTIIKTPHTKREITKIRSYASLYQPNNKHIYLADIEGLKVFNHRGEKIDNITLKGKPIYGFKLVSNSNDLIWIATFDDGILGIKNNKVVVKLNKKNGLASNEINTIQVCPNGLWISTSKGFQLYNSQTKKLATLTRQEGVDSYQIRAIEVFNNEVFYINNLGLYSFNTEKVFKKKRPPKVYITQITVEGNPVPLKKNYKLKHNNNTIDISFNTKNLQSLSNTIYEYKFNNDTNWTAIKEGVDFIKFINLSHDNYIFQLRAKDRQSNAYSEEIVLQFIILAPIYQRWWFLLLVAITLLGAIIYYFKYNTKKLKQRQARELEKERISKALVFSQLENLRSQMNPHFVFNALNSIQHYIIQNESKLARQFLVRFSRLIRIYLEHSQKSRVSLADEISALQLYLTLEKDRFDGQLHFNITIGDNIHTNIIQIPSLFIQPYVENALQHGLHHKKDNKRLQISFTLSADQSMLICVIDDNGIGRKASEEIKDKTMVPKSFATQANQKRVDLLNATSDKKISLKILDKTDTSGNPLGTQVVINIPIKR